MQIRGKGLRGRDHKVNDMTDQIFGNFKMSIGVPADPRRRKTVDEVCRSHDSGID